jgi:DNA polymerase III delta prime subunit
MTNYDFSSLNDKEFEVLVADLLSADHGVRFERFKTGKDGGVDGRYFSPAGGQVIFQCKHWVKSGLAALLRSLEKVEQAKVARLKPTRYIIATSIPLSAIDKKRIRSIFGKYMSSDTDVLGSEDINDLLRRFNHVEKSHFKLWLHSAEVLNTITNSAILGRSAFTLQQIRDRSKSYVQTASYLIAKEKIKSLGVLLITGEPGIGKTTLAEQICFEYVADGYQLCVAASQIEELEALYRDDARQIFYFDDFLGSNFLAVLNRHEDTHIVSFIQRVSKDKKKRFILTSRTTVLNRGKSLTDRFKLARLERNEFEIKVDSLSEIERAKILHSCIWFSGLPRNYIEIFTHQRRYWNAIKHKNFNPRLIAFITDPARLGNLLPSDYWAYIEENLNNPVDVWDHVFQNQMSDGSRLIVLLVVFSGGGISELRLQSCFENLVSQPHLCGYFGEADFDMCMRLLVGSVLNRTIEFPFSNAVISLFNPSIADYVFRKTATSHHKLVMVLSALSDSYSFGSFAKLILSGIVHKELGKSVVASLCMSKLTGSGDLLEISYQSRLALAALELGEADSAVMSQIQAWMRVLAGHPSCSQFLVDVAPLIVYALKDGSLSTELVVRFLSPIEGDQFDTEDFEVVAKILPLLPFEMRANFLKDFKPVIVDCWQNQIEREIVERDVLGDFYDVDEIGLAEQKVSKEVGEILAAYEIEFSSEDIGAISECVDVSDVIRNNIERSMEESRDDERTSFVNHGASAVDDLFAFDLPETS